MLKIIIGYTLAGLLWFFMFSPWTSSLLNFWVAMLISTGVLTIFSLVSSGKEELKKIIEWKNKWLLIGILSAVVLYLIFLAGNYFSGLLFDFTESQVSNIYSTKEQADKILIGLALLLWIGPAEEFFWRGYAQQQLSKMKGSKYSFILTSFVYALVHIWSFNFMLVMAALVCGLFWGWLFMKYKNIIPGIISHAVWDLFVFIIIPIT